LPARVVYAKYGNAKCSLINSLEAICLFPWYGNWNPHYLCNYWEHNVHFMENWGAHVIHEMTNIFSWTLFTLIIVFFGCSKKCNNCYWTHVWISQSSIRNAILKLKMFNLCCIWCAMILKWIQWRWVWWIIFAEAKYTIQ